MFINSLGLLSKNRDKETMEKEEIIHTDEMMAVRTAGSSYFSLGMNKYGCAFVSTAVNSPEWTAAIEHGEIDKAREIMAIETKDHTGPTQLLSDLLPSVKSIDDWEDALEASDSSWRGYNLVMIDKKSNLHMETYGENMYKKKMDDRYVVTNHFRKLNWGAKVPSEYKNSFNRYDYATEKIPNIFSHRNLFEAIAPSDTSDAKKIWRNGFFSTISSTVIDVNNMCLYRCKKPNGMFEKIDFVKV